MNQKNQQKAILFVALAVLSVCAVAALLIILLGIPVASRLINQPGPAQEIQTAEPESLKITPEVDLLGIWQQNRSMAAGWADRYHFYPSGTFHFYPNQMTCALEKVEKAGTWQLEGSKLTLTTTRQVKVSFEVHPGGMCTAIGEEEVTLAEPVIELFAVVDLGKPEGDPYTSISLDGLQFWRFSEDASRYGDEKFPE